MNYVFIHGYTMGNFGDDLMICLLCRRYPTTKFKGISFLPGYDYDIRFNHIKNCRIISQDNKVLKLVNATANLFGIQEGYRKLLIRMAEATVEIGGSLFIQADNDWKSKYSFSESMVNLSRRIFLVGSNFGPFTDSDFFEHHHKLFKRYTGISFRDTVSYNLFKSLDNVIYAPDVVFNSPNDELSKEKRVSFVPIDLENRTGKFGISEYEDDYMLFHINMIKEFIARGYSISLVAFCRYQGDDYVIHKMMERLSPEIHTHIHVVTYTTDLDIILNELKSSEIIVGTRFHGLVLGYLYGCNVLPIIYDRKTDGLLKDLEVSNGLQMPDLKNTDISSIVSDITASNPLDISSVIDQASNQFAHIDSFLNP